jgi:hypothetical protein
MAKKCKQEQKIDGRTALAKRRRTLVAAYEEQIGSALSPATRSLIARAVAIEITLEAIEADQVAGKPIDAVMHARLAGSLARLLDRLGLTVRPAASAAPTSSRPLTVEILREPCIKLAQERAAREGWSDAERDRYAEELFQRDMSAA